MVGKLGQDTEYPKCHLYESNLPHLRGQDLYMRDGADLRVSLFGVTTTLDMWAEDINAKPKSIMG